MNHWNQQLLQTLHQYSIKLLCIVSCLCTLIGCKQTPSYTIGEWIQCINEEAGIETVDSTKDIEISLDKENSYYEEFQKAEQWEILPEGEKNPEEELTKEYVAYTLVHLCDLEKLDTNVIVEDLQESKYPDEVEVIVSNLIMSVNQINQFQPKEKVNQEEAINYAKCIKKRMNHKSFSQSESNIKLRDSLEIIEQKPDTFDTTQLVGIYEDTQFQIGDILKWYEGNETYIYEVESVEKQEDGYHVQFIPFDMVSNSDSISLEGNTELDFTQLDLYEGTSLENIDESNPNEIVPTSIHSLTKTFQFQDYTIELRGSGSSLSARVYKKCKYGTQIESSIVLTNVHVTYAFRSEKKDLNNAYFKIDFDSTESLSVKNGLYKNLYGDFSKVDSNQFLPSITKLFQEKNDVEQKTLTLCTFTVPIPQAPVLNVTMSLELHLNASGKASISLKQENGIGFETKNGAFRTIKETNNTTDASLKGSTELLTGVTFALNLIKGKLMDASLNAGVKADVTTVVNLYDSKGNLQQKDTNIATDIVDELADGNDDILVCSNMKTYWSANLTFNSSSSFVGKYGLGKKISLLNSKNASIPNLSAHFENGHKVDQCTRNSRKVLPTAEGIVTKEQICLSNYAFAIKKGQQKQIQITGLPKSYTKNDLIYTSNHTNLASVDGEGNVYGISSGSVEITIQTKDKKHIVHCSVMVMEK